MSRQVEVRPPSPIRQRLAPPQSHPHPVRPRRWAGRRCLTTGQSARRPARTPPALATLVDPAPYPAQPGRTSRPTATPRDRCSIPPRSGRGSPVPPVRSRTGPCRPPPTGRSRPNRQTPLSPWSETSRGRRSPRAPSAALAARRCRGTPLRPGRQGDSVLRQRSKPCRREAPQTLQHPAQASDRSRQAMPSTAQPGIAALYLTWWRGVEGVPRVDCPTCRFRRVPQRPPANWFVP